MTQLDHPTHHRPFVKVCGGLAAAGGVVFAGSTATFDDPRLATGVTAVCFLATVIGGLVWTDRHCRRCTCPRCGRRLNRDRTAPRGEYRFPCEPCDVTWRSKIVAGG